MLGEPYSECEDGVCSREDCFSDCERERAELACGCRDPLVSELCPSVQSSNLTQTRDKLPECNFEGMNCLITNNGKLLEISSSFS